MVAVYRRQYRRKRWSRSIRWRGHIITGYRLFRLSLTGRLSLPVGCACPGHTRMVPDLRLAAAAAGRSGWHWYGHWHPGRVGVVLACGWCNSLTLRLTIFGSGPACKLARQTRSPPAVLRVKSQVRFSPTVPVARDYLERSGHRDGGTFTGTSRFPNQSLRLCWSFDSKSTLRRSLALRQGRPSGSWARVPLRLFALSARTVTVTSLARRLPGRSSRSSGLADSQ